MQQRHTFAGAVDDEALVRHQVKRLAVLAHEIAEGALQRLSGAVEELIAAAAGSSRIRRLRLNRFAIDRPMLIVCKLGVRLELEVRFIEKKA
jgi:hypothetical protein